jgi:integrase
VAKLYKPTIVTYRLKDGSYRTAAGKRVTLGTPGAVRSVSRSRKWYGRYTDGAGHGHRVPLSESKETARRMLAKLAGDSQLAGVGIADPFADHRGRPIAEHLEDFRRYLLAKGDTPGHVHKTCARVGAVLEGCGFRELEDLQASDVVEFLGRLRNQPAAPTEIDSRKEWYTRTELVAVTGVHPGSVARMLRRLGMNGTGNGKARRYPASAVAALAERTGQGAGPSTCNHYLPAAKGFTRWLARDRRIAADPLAHLSRMNAEPDVRRERRALREDAFARFIEATGAGKSFRGLTGADRLVLYTLAANTGFRAGELASLTPASFDFDPDAPHVTVGAAYSKRRRRDRQPLRADVAELLRAYTAGRPRQRPLWPGTWKDDAADMLFADLAAAGIPYQDESGRYFDFHALRGQFISLLAAKGVHPKVAQVLARHSTITLTMDYYTHLDVLDVGAALDKLPAVQAPAARATGRPELTPPLENPVVA